MTPSTAHAVNSPLAWLNRLAALFYPEICQICREGKATPREGYLCGSCRDSIEWVEQPLCQCCGLPFEGAITVAFECSNCCGQQLHFRAARAAVRFSGAVQEAVHRYKYNHAAWFEPLLAELLVTRAAPALAAESWNWIVPIPLHWTRRRQRAFNQSERLAKALSRASGIPLNSGLIRRREATPPQALLSREERAANMRRAFSYRGSKPLEGARIVLVDDVLTTGATASACAKVLMDNGSGVIDVWTVARGIPR